MDTFHKTADLHGLPAALLSDNGAVFTATPKLHRISVGRAHKGRPTKLLIADQDIRIIDLDNGQLIRELTLDPSRDYKPLGWA